MSWNAPSPIISPAVEINPSNNEAAMNREKVLRSSAGREQRW